MLLIRTSLLALAVCAVVALAGGLDLRASPAEAANDAVAIAAGERHTCAVTAAGGVKCWGGNTWGMLGDGQACGDPCTTPVDVCADAACAAPLSNVTAVSAGWYHTCALTTTGGVKCWGASSDGQLGDGQTCVFPCATPVGSATPVDVCADATCAASLGGVAAVSAGGYHACALTSAGAVKCWGSSLFGELGDGTTTDRLTPVDVCADTSCAVPLTGVTAISAGSFHTCALTAASSVKCWGWNAEGELGDGTTTEQAAPVDVCSDTTCAAPLSGVAAVSSGYSRTCAVASAGSAKCWGHNNVGQLGDGTTTNRTTPVDVCADATCAAPLSGIAAVATGLSHSCAVTAAGAVKCWGYNSVGQRGDGLDGPFDFSATPVDVCAPAATAPCGGSILGSVVAVSAAAMHTCAVTAYGGVTCWGWNRYGQLGEGTTTGPQLCTGDPCSTTPVGLAGKPAPVGGFVRDLAGPEGALEAGGSSTGSGRGASVPGAGVLAGIAAVASVGAVALGGGAWYAKRRRRGR